MSTIFKKVEDLLNLGERFHFLGALASAFLGKKPSDDAPMLQKGVYRFLGAGKDDELRVGKLIREIAESQPEDAELFIDFCIWLFKPSSESLVEAFEAKVLRNAFFVYIAKASELNPPAQKVGSRTTTVRYSLSDPDAVGKTRKVEEKTTNNITNSSAIKNHGRALIEEIVAMIRSFRANLRKSRSAPDELRLMQQAFRSTQERLYNGRGIPCRKVGDAGFEEWFESFTGFAVPALEDLGENLHDTNEKVTALREKARNNQPRWTRWVTNLF